MLAARLLDDGEDGASSLGDVAGLLSKMHPQQGHRQQQQGSATAAGSGPAGKRKLGVVMNDPVAERRKQKAMAVLDARLKAMEKDHQQKERAKAGKGEAKGADAVEGDEENDDLEASISSKSNKAKATAGRK